MEVLKLYWLRGHVNNEHEQLRAGLESWGIIPSDQQIAAMIQYLELLAETNRSFNLTRIPRNDYVTLHLLDSLSCMLEIEARPGLKLIDVGTGAGFPGVPLAAMLPDASFTLLDATAKKVRFVVDSATRCGITNLVGVHGRAEQIALRPEYSQHFDVVVSRAVAAFPTLMEWLLPLTKPGGKALAMKGSGYQSEMQDSDKLLRRLGAKIEKITPVQLPGTDIERYLIVVRKGCKR